MNTGHGSRILQTLLPRSWIIPPSARSHQHSPEYSRGTLHRPLLPSTLSWSPTLLALSQGVCQSTPPFSLRPLGLEILSVTGCPHFSPHLSGISSFHGLVSSILKKCLFLIFCLFILFFRKILFQTEAKSSPCYFILDRSGNSQTVLEPEGKLTIAEKSAQTRILVVTLEPWIKPCLSQALPQAARP